MHAGGLRYHGSAPLVSHLLAAGLIEAEAYHQGEVFESAVKFARCEGTIPAPESAHAIHSVVRHALAARESGEAKVILFNLSGHGVFDLAAYESFLDGKMADARECRLQNAKCRMQPTAHARDRPRPPHPEDRGR